jgi:hypothetical protein
VVVAMGVAWWVDRRTLQNEREEARKDWYDLTRSIWDSGYEVDPNQKWHLIPRKPTPASKN